MLQFETTFVVVRVHGTTFLLRELVTRDEQKENKNEMADTDPCNPTYRTRRVAR